MNEREFEVLDRIEEDHWWFRGKRLLLRALLGDRVPGRLVDLGCGTGGVLRDWMREGVCLGVDRSSFALSVCRAKGFPRLVQGDLTTLPLRPTSFDTVLALDVIEHLPDDVAFLKGAAALCAPGGRVIVGVPAFQLLWSQHDRTFQHHRRYSAGQLRAAVLAAGLRIERITYTNFLVFPATAVWRILSYRLGLGRLAPAHDLWTLPRWLNGALTRVYQLEARLLQRFDLPFGVSVVCIASRSA